MGEIAGARGAAESAASLIMLRPISACITPLSACKFHGWRSNHKRNKHFFPVKKSIFVAGHTSTPHGAMSLGNKTSISYQAVHLCRTVEVCLITIGG